MRSHATLVGLALLLAVPCAGAEEPALARALEGALGKIERCTALVVELDDGEALFAREPDRALVPASNMKLLTTAAALELLGPDFAHRTRVVMGGEVRGGTLTGDLWIVGGGDPTLSRRFDPAPLLDEVARAVAAAGVRRVSGDLVADDRAFDAVRLHPSWEAADAERWYGAEVCALTLNDNCVDLEVAGAANGPAVRLRPETGYVRLEVAAALTDREDRHVWSVARVGADRRTLRITGRVWRRAGGYETSVPVRDPALFFAAVLRERLRAHGVEVAGADRRPAAGEAAPTGPAVWRRAAPLPRTLAVTNQRSQNLYAECLLKTLGRLPEGWRPGAAIELEPGGSWARGAAVVADFARRCGADPEAVRVADGSGLSRENALSARALVAVLRAAARGPHGAAYRASLARPGQEGTLARRLRGLASGVTLEAKTGTLTGVAALSGFLSRGERTLVFALVANGRGASRRALDRAVRLLADHLAAGS